MKRGRCIILIAELEKRMDQRFDAERRAVDQAYATLDKRLESMNEFRDENRQLTATFARRDYVDSKVGPLEQSKATLEGKASQSTAAGALALSVLSILTSILIGALTLTRGL